MDGRHHEQIAVWERRWIAASGLMSLTFVILIAYSLATEGAHIAQTTARGTPETLLATALFAEPGVRVTAPGRVQVSLVAQAFSFQPERVQVPVDAEVTFYLTARDVLHGWQVERTSLNAMVVPGEIASLRYTFKQPGTYRVTCNEYCGIGHQGMLGTIEVVEAVRFGRSDAPSGTSATAAAPGAGAASPAIDGAGLYGANCASCHGVTGAGIPGAFPPLASHAADLAAADRGYLAAAVLFGLQGPITVDGRSYNGVMPGWTHLSDAQIAAILDHVIGLGGPAVAPYEPDEVALTRARELRPADVLVLRREVIEP